MLLICIASVLVCSAAEFSLVVPESSVSAQLGSSVVLPCSLSPPLNSKTFEVQWYKNEDSKKTVMLHKAENVQEIRRDARYKDRVSLIGELEKGNISLELNNFTAADEGEYVCHAQSISWYEKASVNLVVKALGSPVVVSSADAGILTSHVLGVNVTCTSGGWSPKPTLTWRDSAGRELPNTHTHYRTDSEGLVSVSSWLLVSPSQSDWISCTVGLNHQEVRESRIVPLRGFWKAFILTLVVSLIIIIIIFTILLILFKKVNSHESLQSESVPLNTTENTKRVSLTLDPSTAAKCLKVSRDGKSVSYKTLNSKSDCKFPDVVSKEKFGSGQHYWEVMIWDKTSRAQPKSSWCVGVTQKPHSETQKPHSEKVLRALCYEEGSGLYANTHDFSKISTECNMYTLGLHLDCERRKLTFYNADKPFKHDLYTFNTIPQGTYYAFLSPGVKDDHPIRILNQD
ncbi:butyrophilin subfamily 1 member A1-like isoform X2 [Clarias gariepinus]|uniref:butyrophilin subfamily 1 member A1-like isoform X2 n=1 Tax=Clarias gariepinus TaxID=13013 RepID=UPI00234C24B0|nr:butyrophilin subfamily 1 member A1-like isoform X2 [Clarias gariepinus]